MSSRYVKIPAQQGNLTSGLLDFEIPDNGYINPSNSYVSVMLNITTPETAGNPVGIHNIYPVPKSRIPYSNSCFIQDFDLTCDKFGSLEALTDSNVASENLNVFRRDFEDVMSSNYRTLSQFSDSNFVNTVRWTSMLQELNVSEPSFRTPFEVMIPLKDFMKGIGNLNVYPCTQMGRSRLHLRWNQSYITFSEYLPYPIAGGGSLACDDIAAGDAGGTSLYTTGTTWTSENVKNAYLWVGQSVRIMATVGFAAGLRGTITSVAVQGTGKLRINLSGVVGAVGTAVTGITLSTLPADSIVAIYSSPMLVVEQLFPSKLAVKNLLQSKQLVYYPFEVEKDNISAVASYNRLFASVSGNVRNVLGLKVINASDNLISERDTMVTYRIKVNGIDLTNRPIPIGATRFVTPLYLDQLQKMVDNLQNVELKSLYRNYGQLLSACFPVVLPEDNVDKMVQLSITASANMAASTLFLFKEMERVINL